MFNRREILKLGAGGTLMAFFKEAKAAQDTPVSAQVKLLWDFLKQNAHHNFVILDKKNAKILIIEDDKKLLTSDALIGKSRGDDERNDPNVTPAGSFNVEIKPSDRAPGTVLYFLCEKGIGGQGDTCYSIHPTATTERAKHYGNPQIAAISGGCVNLPIENYIEVANFYKRHQNDARRPLFVVLPQNPDLNKTREFFGIPEESSSSPSLTP